MGCDIHEYFERRVVTAVHRADGEMRRLERAAQAGDSDAGALLAQRQTVVWEYMVLRTGDAEHQQKTEFFAGGKPRDRYAPVHPAVPVVWDGGRCYDLFGLLAGVRTQNTPKIPPRGLPDDLSPEMQAIVAGWHYGQPERQRIDYHNPGWLTAGEIADLMEGWTPRWGLNHGGHPLYAMAVRLGQVYGPEDVRMVFWFDN